MLAEPVGTLERLRAALAERYAVERELGHGGMATVYLARDLKHQRLVAIKVLRPELSDLLGRERFLREIEIAAGLQHPHILPLHESGAADRLLFYVMPYVEGESLRDRLDREKQLPLEDVLQIAREVADALSYAHSHGVVHRDIKPANVMLSGGHALVADFGIARAITAAGGEQLTQSGIAVGTPAYMSPEQGSGRDPIDGRSDVYALGCVVYEMLAGEPPFTGSTAQAIIARHMQERPPSLRVVRPTVSLAVQRVIERALAKVPADRFATAAGFAVALAKPARRPFGRLRFATLAGLGLTAVAVRFWGVRGGPSLGEGRETAAVDTARYVILPFERHERVTPFHEDQLLHDALTRWTGIAVVDPFQVRDALARRGSGALSSRDARGVAVELGAGRYVRGEASKIGDSIRVHAAVYDAAGTGSLLRERTVKLGTNLTRADSAFGALAEHLLFENAASEGRLDARSGTTSFSARLAFARGQAAVEQWNLAAADSAFAAATEHDPQYAQAHLWLAQVRFWGEAAPATWRSPAERAGAARGRLSSRDQLLSDALVAFGRGELVRSCGAWTRLTEREPHDFAGWYGLANCLRRDDAVLRDPASPSGWRFRTSYHQTTRAYQRAFHLLPSIHKSLRRDSYEFVRQLLMTGGSSVRWGRAVAPDTTRFGANPSWHGDTLLLVPYPHRQFARLKGEAEAMRVAVQRERELFHDIATAWAAAFPKSADAVEALALSLDMLGDPAAIGTLRRARGLATTPEERLRVAGAEVWMRVKFSVPSDLAGLRGARALADSLLREHRPPNAPEPLLLASLAALTGRANLAAELTRQPAVVAEWDVPAQLSIAAGPLLSFAALGGPVDSLRELEHQVEAAIDRGLLPSLQPGARMAWLARAATIAFPDYRFSSLPKLVGAGDYDIDAEAAFLRGDTAAVRRILADVQAVRRRFSPADLSPDALFPEAWLLAALGDDRAAITWIEPTLRALPLIETRTFLDPANAGALIRMMALRAELAGRVGDPTTAARWARTVSTLWSDADPFLQTRMRQIERLVKVAP